MGKREDITGQKFGRLTALAFIDVRKTHPRWLFRCDCANAVVALLGNVKDGRSSSCGCFRIEKSTKHGNTQKGKTPTYVVWNSLKGRCLTKSDRNYPIYGGRGIGVCDEWLTFEGFLNDMGERPPGLSIDRINNDLGYSKQNCRWATKEVQAINRRILRGRVSQYRGVAFQKKTKKWRAGISYGKKAYHIGYFFSEIEAAQAYNIQAKVHHGEYAQLNIVPDEPTLGTLVSCLPSL